MIRTLAFAGYRSPCDVELAVGRLTAITGGNGTGKSNVYRGLCLLDAADGQLARAELSDGTLRYLVLLAALHAPRPPELLVVDEPETSLHPRVEPRPPDRGGAALAGDRGLARGPARPHDLQGARCDTDRGQTVVTGRAPVDEPARRWTS